MAWYVLINTTGTHRKYYSAEKATEREDFDFTGNVVFGRIGVSRRLIIYRDSFTVRRKLAEKTNEGYRVFNENAEIPFVSEREFRERVENVVPERREPASRTVVRQRRQRTRRPQTRQRPRSTEIFDFEIPEVEIQSYKTNREGYIEKYRQGYERYMPERSITERQRRDIKFWDKSSISNAPSQFQTKVKEFHDNISENQVLIKYPFGFRSGGTFGRDISKHFYVSKGRTLIAGFSARKDGLSEFFYIKTNISGFDESDYAKLIHKILFRIHDRSRDSGRDTMNVFIMGDVTTNRMKNFLDDNNVSYRVSQISYPNTSKRPNKFVINRERVVELTRVFFSSSTLESGRVQRWQDL